MSGCEERYFPAGSEWHSRICGKRAKFTVGRRKDGEHYEMPLCGIHVRRYPDHVRKALSVG